MGDDVTEVFNVDADDVVIVLLEFAADVEDVEFAGDRDVVPESVTSPGLEDVIGPSAV